MEHANQRPVHFYKNGALTGDARPVAQEFPVRLTVNGRELATLIASPHQLNFLVAGFLRNQGFVEVLDDILQLGVCAEFGAAQVRLRGEIPERLQPTLTSGCGTGISFNLQTGSATLPRPAANRQRVTPAAIFTLMRELQQRAEQYRSHGGIHSAAVGDGEKLLLYAEDLGRHNTLDRIAGEALFKGIDLAGKLLVTSGRVSTEMVAKAARLGIPLIASRTSPTDMAIRMSEELGITLIGYLRGESFEVYSRPEGLAAPRRKAKIAGVSAVILAGGESRRMGSDKSLLPWHGGRFIEHIHRLLDELFDEVIIVTNSPGLYDSIPCRKEPDIYYKQGSLAGIHSGLCHARNERIFVVACDMPFLSEEVIRALCACDRQAEVVIPRSEWGLEPLHACYAKSCLPAIEAVLDAGKKRIVGFFPEVRVVEVAAAELKKIDPEGLSFRNINTPEEYFALRDQALASTETAVSGKFAARS
ncbi:formate dehydrogenase accessory sulfurtransferase FdhD [Trichloromonas acetexigens]|uniref:Multifunctional fusion protein n=1 Tax=Trichloromonas acetexigens TaxID=38815 RepID=A0A550J7U1_9BACT|nr:formate dehydrogenase accessory sulfurtransferase FdhD [Desulfuromonas acetexigens]TRO79295.1 formate dehydrogenase accessory sulfurtransferase FdhD [Desulfuromonas acetexigens]